MTKKSLLEAIQKRLKVLDETNQFGLQYIEGVVGMYWEKMVFNYIAKGGIDPTFYTNMYTKTSVSTDDNGLYYVDIPVKVIRYPNGYYSSGSEGVIAIYAISTGQNKIVPIREAEYYSIKNLEVYLSAAEHYFWVTFDKIYFSDNLTSEITDNGVRLNLLIDFSVYEYTDNLPLPTDMEQVLAEQALNYLLGTPVPDLNNNNSDE